MLGKDLMYFASHGGCASVAMYDVEAVPVFSGTPLSGCETDGDRRPCRPLPLPILLLGLTSERGSPFLSDTKCACCWLSPAEGASVLVSAAGGGRGGARGARLVLTLFKLCIKNKVSRMTQAPF